MRNRSATGPEGPVTSQRRIASAPVAPGSPHSFAMSAADSARPIASPRSLRNCLNSGPVTGFQYLVMCEVGHMPPPGSGLYRGQSFQEEASMRRLIESLAPGERPISWKLIGSMFAFYVVVVAAAAGLFASHQSRANLPHEAGTTVAADRMQ